MPGQLAPLFVMVQAPAICQPGREFRELQLPSVPAWFGFNANT